jgi:hypothetical protein
MGKSLNSRQQRDPKPQPNHAKRHLQRADSATRDTIARRDNRHGVVTISFPENQETAGPLTFARENSVSGTTVLPAAALRGCAADGGDEESAARTSTAGARPIW